MLLTRQFHQSASLRAQLTVFALTVGALPFVAAAVSRKETSEFADVAKQTVAGAEAGKETTKSVVAHWRFQNGTDGSAASRLQLITDSSGNDRHGRACGGPKYRSIPLPSSTLGLVFDGRDDRVFVPDHKIFHLTKSFTIEAYIQVNFYASSAARLNQIVFRGDERAGFDPWFLAVSESGQLTFAVYDALNRGSVVRSPEPLPTGELLHVAATLEHETGRQSVFINGKRVATTKTSVRAFGALGGRHPGIGIGNRQRHSDHAFCGTIAELRISSAALAPEQFLVPPGTTR